jgi:hypothetical protein
VRLVNLRDVLCNLAHGKTGDQHGSKTRGGARPHPSGHRVYYRSSGELWRHTTASGGKVEVPGGTMRQGATKGDFCLAGKGLASRRLWSAQGRHRRACPMACR